MRDEKTSDERGKGSIDIDRVGYEMKSGEYGIDVKIEEGSRIVKNDRAGVSIIVPFDWVPQSIYNTDANKELKLKVYKSYSSESEVSIEMGDGIVVSVYMYDSNGSDLKN